MTVNLGTCVVATAVTIFAPSFAKRQAELVLDERHVTEGTLHIGVNAQLWWRDWSSRAEW